MIIHMLSLIFLDDDACVNRDVFFFSAVPLLIFQGRSFRKSHL